MDRVIILRGPSGFGKSTHAKKNFPEYATIISADDFWWRKSTVAAQTEHGYFVNPVEEREGSYYEYLFNPAKLGEAHADCMRRFLLALEDGKEPWAPEDAVVILDNTCIRQWEYAHYVQAAKLAGYVVEIHEPDVQALTVAQIGKMYRRCLHRVPLDIILKQFNLRLGIHVFNFSLIDGNTTALQHSACFAFRLKNHFFGSSRKQVNVALSFGQFAGGNIYLWHAFKNS